MEQMHSSAAPKAKVGFTSPFRDITPCSQAMSSGAAVPTVDSRTRCRGLLDSPISAQHGSLQTAASIDFLLAGPDKDPRPCAQAVRPASARTRRPTQPGGADAHADAAAPPAEESGGFRPCRSSSSIPEAVLIKVGPRPARSAARRRCLAGWGGGGRRGPGV
jgi:hypothetical protein